MPKLIDITGQRFSSLVVLRYAGGSKWGCRCDCGEEAIVDAANLKSGNTRSCGCRKGVIIRKRLFKHGHATKGAPSKTYSVWASMINRCRNPNDSHWEYYGGRGIKVCDRWHDFQNFLADMGESPPRLTLERVDNDGDYEPTNCVWDTMEVQSNNRRSRWRV